MIDNIEKETKDVFVTNSNDEFVFFFDGIIVQFNKMIESDLRIIIEKDFSKYGDLSFYPSKNNDVLWWRINLFRNRISHCDEKRYIYGIEECSCFSTFSSRCNIIHIDDNYNIFANSSLIDINKIENRDQFINCAIKEKKNLMDILFPNKSAKGRHPKEPIVNVVCGDYYFDYAKDSLLLLDEICNCISQINQIFMNYIYESINNKKELIDRTTIICYEDKELLKKNSEIYSNIK